MYLHGKELLLNWLSLLGGQIPKSFFFQGKELLQQRIREMWEKRRKNYLGPLQGDKNHSLCGNESPRAGSWCGQRSLGRFLQDLGMATGSQGWESSAWVAFPSQENWDCTSRVNPAGNKQLPPDSWLREGQGGSCSLSGAFQIKFAAGMDISQIWGGTGSSASRICVERRGFIPLGCFHSKGRKTPGEGRSCSGGKAR